MAHPYVEARDIQGYAVHYYAPISCPVGREFHLLVRTWRAMRHPPVLRRLDGMWYSQAVCFKDGLFKVKKIDLEVSSDISFAQLARDKLYERLKRSREVTGAGVLSVYYQDCKFLSHIFVTPLGTYRYPPVHYALTGGLVLYENKHTWDASSLIGVKNGAIEFALASVDFPNEQIRTLVEDVRNGARVVNKS